MHEVHFLELILDVVIPSLGSIPQLLFSAADMLGSSLGGSGSELGEAQVPCLLYKKAPVVSLKSEAVGVFVELRVTIKSTEVMGYSDF